MKQNVSLCGPDLPGVGVGEVWVRGVGGGGGGGVGGKQHRHTIIGA